VSSNKIKNSVRLIKKFKEAYYNDQPEDVKNKQIGYVDFNGQDGWDVYIRVDEKTDWVNIS
jgi:hypothetical protein